MPPVEAKTVAVDPPSSFRFDKKLGVPRVKKKGVGVSPKVHDKSLIFINMKAETLNELNQQKKTQF
jgi:hypothetical protein